MKLLYRLLIITFVVGIMASCDNEPSGRSDEIKTIEFELRLLNNAINPDSLQLRFPKLKYNKQLLVSYIIDNGAHSFYSSAFSYTNKKWIDDMTYIHDATHRLWFYHKATKPTTGYYPERSLTFTDGAGVEHRFSFSLACRPMARDYRGDLQMDKYDPGIAHPWSTFGELAYAFDFGCHPALFDINLADDEEKTPQTISKGFDECARLFRKHMDYRVKTLVCPQADERYALAGRMNPHVKCIVMEENPQDTLDYTLICDEKLHYMNGSLNLDKSVHTFKNRHRRNNHELVFSNRTIIGDLAHIRHLPDSAKHWLGWYTHEAGQGQNSTLDMLYETFGKEGDDSMWFTTVDEYYEYWYMTSGARVSKKVLAPDRVKFSIRVPVGADFYHQDLSVMVSGISSEDDVIATSSANVYGTSYAMNEGELLINLNFDEQLPRRAEKYMRRFEQTGALNDFEDAHYFLLQLKPGLIESYKERLDNKVYEIH